MKTIRAQLLKEKEQLEKELITIKEKYPLVYLAYLVEKMTIAEIAIGAIEHSEIDRATVAKLTAHYRLCRGRFDRDAGRATNSEEAGSAVETFTRCIGGGI